MQDNAASLGTDVSVTACKPSFHLVETSNVWLRLTSGMSSPSSPMQGATSTLKRLALKSVRTCFCSDCFIPAMPDPFLPAPCPMNILRPGMQTQCKSWVAFSESLCDTHLAFHASLLGCHVKPVPEHSDDRENKDDCCCCYWRRSRLEAASTVVAA